MADYNRVIMIGNLTRDPELKTLPSGQPLCRLGIASNRQFRNRQTGAMVQEVCFVDVDVWGNQAESCRQYLQKGRPVLIEGRLKFDTWQDNNGATRSKHSIVADRIVFLSSAAGAQAGSSEEIGDMSDDDSGPREPGSQLERELLDQIGQIKSRVEKKAIKGGSESSDLDGFAGQDSSIGAAKDARAVQHGKGATKRSSKVLNNDTDLDGQLGSDASSVGFQDAPPFEDDLPF